MTSLVILASVWTQRALLSKPHPPQLEVSFRVPVNFKGSLWAGHVKDFTALTLGRGSRRAGAIKTEVALGCRVRSGQLQDHRIMHSTWPTSCSNSDPYGRTSCSLEQSMGSFTSAFADSRRTVCRRHTILLTVFSCSGFALHSSYNSLHLPRLICMHSSAHLSALWSCALFLISSLRYQLNNRVWCLVLVLISRLSFPVSVFWVSVCAFFCLFPCLCYWGRNSIDSALQL